MTPIKLPWELVQLLSIKRGWALTMCMYISTSRSRRQVRLCNKILSHSALQTTDTSSKRRVHPVFCSFSPFPLNEGAVVPAFANRPMP